MNKKKMGRPKSDNPRASRLPSVRITKDQLDRYQSAARKAGVSFGEWVRRVLDKASN